MKALEGQRIIAVETNDGEPHEINHVQILLENGTTVTFNADMNYWQSSIILIEVLPEGSGND